LVFGRRSSGMAESPGMIWPALGEGGNRTLDRDSNGAPDHLAIARRGALEELGINIHDEQVTWLSLGASSREWS